MNLYKQIAQTSTATDGDNIDVLSACFHRFNPRRRRVVRVPVRHDHQVVEEVRPVSVARLEHDVCGETVKK